MFHDFVFEIAAKRVCPQTVSCLAVIIWPTDIRTSATARGNGGSSKIDNRLYSGGYSKIHIDTSMHIGSDDMSLRSATKRLRIGARRFAARLKMPLPVWQQ
jgi:tagatose-1,6-bisphosphate aldolase non-catalytic subunit AgaZ/GatZ